MTSETISIALAALTTLATIASIGLAFLLQPGRATLLWSFAFTLAMTATFASATGEMTDWETVRRIGLGALMGAPAFLWSGFRVKWGRRAYAWSGAVVAAVSATVLGVVPDPAFVIAYRSVFLVASIFAGLFFIDWVRVRDRRNDPVTTPLAVSSLAFVVLGATVFIVGLTDPTSTMEDLAPTRLVSMIGMLGYVACAAIAVVGSLLREARDARRASASGNWAAFQPAARERLAAAARASEPLSLMYVNLDDLVEIRQAAGAGVLAGLTAQFIREAKDVFPPASLIDSPAPGAIVALVPTVESAVRELLKVLLDRITTLDVSGRLPIQPSASVGWAPTSVLGFDLDALVYMGREAAIVAAQAGGDRWERVGLTVTNRILNQSMRP